MEMRFSPKCVTAISSLTPFFQENLAGPPADSRYCPPLRAELSTRDSGVNDFLPGNEELHAIEQHCGRQRASDPGLLAVADLGGQKKLEFVCYERGLRERKADPFLALICCRQYHEKHRSH